MQTPRTVKDLSKLSGVSVRTLHHYDKLGLLVPAARSSKGYRLYDEGDVLRLQQILIGRELGLPLSEIRASLDDPNFDIRTALRNQRTQLKQRAAQTASTLQAIDHALARLTPNSNKGTRMHAKELFNGFDPSTYEEEAQQQWGETAAYQESARRTRKYTKSDWAAMRQQQAKIYQNGFEALRAGLAPNSEQAREFAERHRLLIDQWFYPCDTAMHARLATTYETDPRFAANLDKFGEGLTTFLCAAIRANQARVTD